MYDVKVDSHVIVFDAKAWNEKGDIEDNSIFNRPAKVIKVYPKNGELLADVRFKHNSEVSKGHYTKHLVAYTPPKDEFNIIGRFTHCNHTWFLIDIDNSLLIGINITPLGNIHRLHIDKSQVYNLIIF